MFKLRHVGIVVSDAERSLKFWEGALGFRVQKDMVESGSYIDNFLSLTDVKVRTIKMVNEEGEMIELLEFESHPELPDLTRKVSQIGCSHVAFTVEDLDKTFRDLVRLGVHFNSEPQLSPDGFVKVTYCKDPDGCLVELVEELK